MKKLLKNTNRWVRPLLLTLFLVCVTLPFLTTEASAAVSIVEFNTAGVAQYKTSPDGEWKDASFADKRNPFNEILDTGYLWVDLNGSSDCDFDFGAVHTNYAITKRSFSTGTLIITSSGGGAFRVWSGSNKSNDNLFKVDPNCTLYVGSNVTIEKKNGCSVIDAGQDAKVYFGGDYVRDGNTKGMWSGIGITSKQYTLNDERIDILYSSGTTTISDYYQLTLTKGANVSSVTYPSGYLPEPYKYEGKYFYKKGTGVTVGGTAETGYYIPSQSVAMNTKKTYEVYASPYTYDITLNKQSGTGGSGSTTATYDSDMPNITVPTRTGYTFGGYFTSTNGNGTKYYNANGTSARTWNIASDDTLYAKWTANTYSVTFDNQSATSEGTTNNIVTYGSAMPNITVPTRTGYTFGGYYTGTGGGGTKYYNANGTSANNWAIASDTTLYARWTANTYTINYNANKPSGASNNVAGSTATSAHTYDTAKNLTSNGFSLTGWTFKGWSTNSTATTATYTNGQSVSNLSTTNNGTVTLYAVWGKNSYTVNYNANKPSGASNNVAGSTATSTHNYDTANNLTSNGFSLPGYTFSGWSTDATATFATYTNGVSVKNLTATANGTVNLYAVWVKNAYTVVYDANKPADAATAVTGTTADSLHTYDTAKNLTTNGYSLAGYTFKGWADSQTDGIIDHADSASVSNLTDAANGTVTLYAVWEKNSYSITFNAQGGSGGTTKAATFDSALPDSVATAKNGYVFGGWYTDTNDETTKYYAVDGSKLKDKYTVVGDITLYAKWTPKTYKILYYNGESYVGEQDATYGSYELKPATNFSLARTHFIFMGWNSYDNQDWAMYQPSKAYTGGLISGDADSAIVYAAWEPVEEYTVTYSANGGAAAPASEKVYADTPTYNIPDILPTRNGYVFKGWSLDSGASTASDLPGGSITVNDNTTLYAVWAQEYAVSYNANGGSGGPANGSYTKGSTVTVDFDPSPTRTGYTFTGWATDSGATTATYTSSDTTNFTMGEAGVTLYAVWTANSYTVSFNANGGSGSMANQSFTYDAAQTLTQNSFTKSGQNFAGWATSAGGGVVYTDLQSVKNLTAAAGGSVTLYAVWSDGLTYYLTYDLNGGSGDTPTSQTGSSVAIADGTGLSRTGYSFAGWNTNANGSGTPYAAPTTHNVTANVTLYAKWTPITYTVKFNANGSTGTMGDQRFTYDAEQALSENTFTSGGYTFLGWATSETGTKVYNDEQLVKNLTSTAGEEINLYPVWQPTVTTVLLNPNGGSGGSSGTSVVYGRAFDGTGLIAPTRYGYVFEGFFLDTNGNFVKDPSEALWFGSDMTPVATLWNYNEATKTLHASWRPVEYTVKFVNGTTELSTSQSVVYGQEFTLKTAAELGINATLTTQHLAGWTTTPASNTVWYTDGQTIATGLTSTDGATVFLYAVFADNGTCILSYDANGGTGAPLPQSQQLQTNTPSLSFTISFTTPTRDNYVFLGWATDSHATDKAHDPGGSITISANTTLYAVWRPLSGYAITYNKNAADTVTGLPDPGVKTENADYTLSSTIPGRTGYDFIGWSTAADGGGTAYASGAAYSGNAALTLYAQWRIKTFTVTPAASATGYTVAAVSSSNTVDYGGEYRFTVTLEEGRDAAAMVVSANGVALSSVGVSGRTYTYTISNITAAQTVTVSGVGTSNYLVAFLMNDGTEAVYLTRSVAHNTAVRKPTDPVRNGYEFKGWYSGETLYNFTSGITGNLNLNAKWTRIATYTVSYDANGGGAAPVEQQKASGVDLTLSAVKPLRTGWNFVGWGTTRDAATVAYYHGGTYSADADITLYAIWSQENFGITLPTGTTGYTVEVVSGYLSPVSYGGTYRFTVTLDTGYSKDALVVAANGVTLAPIAGTNIYVLENIIAAQEVTVTGVAKQRFAVNLPVGEGYTAEGAESVEYGQDYTFTVTLGSGYSSATPVVNNNGEKVLTGTSSSSVYTYTIKNVTEAPKITVTGVTANPVYTVTYSVDGALYTTQSVESGQKATLPYAPVKAGYAFEEWQSSDSVWDFDVSTVAAITVLNAVWTLNEPTVSKPSNYTGEYDAAEHPLAVTTTHPTYGVTFAYQWYKGSVSDENKVGRDSASLNVKNVADCGSYICVVTTSDGKLTSEAVTTGGISVDITPATPRITLADKTLTVGFVGAIGPAVVTGVSGDTATGEVTYSYFSDAACTEPLSEPPTSVGTYYAKAAIAPHGNYAQAVSGAAKLTISPAGGGGVGGGGDSGGGGALAPATVTIPVASGSNTVVQNTYTLEGNEAKLDYDSKVLDEVVASAKDSGTVTVDASAVSEVQAVSLPAGVVSTLSQSEVVKELTVKTPAANITLDAEAMKTITESFDSSYDAVAFKATPIAPEQLTEAQRETIEDTHNAVIIDLSATLTHYNAGGDVTGTKKIHELGGMAKVSFAYELKEGQDPNAIQVYYISESGQTELVEAVYADGVVTLSTTHFSAYVVEYCPMSLFTDCVLSQWYHEDVDYVASVGLMQGMSATTFVPHGTTTRGMIVTILYRMEGEPAVTGACPFDDVETGKYYERAIIWASQNRIVGGYGNGKFGPDDNITREQMAALLWRYAQHKGYDVSVGEDSNILPYNDALEVAEYAIPAFRWACGADLIQGDAGYLMPLNNAQRCQVAAILHRFCENVK